MTGPTVRIDVCAPCRGWAAACPPAARLARAAASRALAIGAAHAALTLPPRVEVAIVLADDAEQRRLNRDWRGVDRPTNVLAFPAWDPRGPAPHGAPLPLGDVVLAFETVSGEAEEQGGSLADHLSHLVVHGVLHLLGYDHDADREAAVMEALETAILASLGVTDPYRGIISASNA